jgi:CubicO group peptidase (beta-lactamase class C family)
MPPYAQFGRGRMEQLKAIPGSHSGQRLAFLAEVLGTESPSNGTGQAAYSNAGYTAAPAMLECSTGESWEDLVISRVTEPLGLATVGFGWPATERDPEQPRGHVRRDGKLLEQPLDDAYALPVVLWPAGAIHCSIKDLARYAADHLDRLSGRKALLPGAEYERLHRTLDRTADGYTLGWGVRSDSRWGIVHSSSGRETMACRDVRFSRVRLSATLAVRSWPKSVTFSARSRCESTSGCRSSPITPKSADSSTSR